MHYLWTFCAKPLRDHVSVSNIFDLVAQVIETIIKTVYDSFYR
jgi:hypothetical protein